MNRRAVMVAVLAAAMSWGLLPAAHAGGQSSLADVRRATAAFHDPAAAEAAGYGAFLPCFDSPDGGMGQHYVNFELVGDGVVDPAAPESLVYEVRDGRLQLVSVEYILPLSVSATPPELFGEEFHEVPSLGIWALHAWVWRPNPDGMFVPFNPAVRSCPTLA